ncbi:DUF262 domain-containing protein [Glycomyces sp. MUSA5-2]|uniref:DUF262 domain-containing protein n=1 Tax=Glycomyces sp. MUSA5-2 TaxID=2053002 RepID=UPI003009EF44
MSGHDPDISIQPEVQLMEAVLRPLADGTLRIPRFQRPFVWEPEQILALFDSIERGYPIGNLLYWEPSEELSSMGKVGDQPIPAAPRNARTSYVLDGHQRLSVLYATLRRPADPPRTSDQDSWQWWPYRVLGLAEDADPEGRPRYRYQHWRKDTEPPPNYLPVRAVLRTVDFLAYCRGLEGRPDLIAEAEQVTQRIREYSVPIVKLEGGSLDKAAEVFTRVNSTGRAMSQAQMVSALTYKEDDAPTLAERIDEIIEDIAGTGFGEVSDKTIFQVVLAVKGEEDYRSPEWSTIAKEMGPTLHETISDAWEALSLAVGFLRDEVEVPSARLIPYDLQLILLATFFSKCSHPTLQQRKVLRRWFWETSWSGHFASSNTTQVRQSLQAMKTYAEEGISPIPKDLKPLPFPERFDQKAARVRAFILWDLIAHKNRLDVSGAVIDAASIYRTSPTATYRHVVSRPTESKPANRLVFPTGPRISVRRALVDLDDRTRPEILESHGIPEAAWWALKIGEHKTFVEERTRFLVGEEKKFMDWILEKSASVGETDGHSLS